MCRADHRMRDDFSEFAPLRRLQVVIAAMAYGECNAAAIDANVA